MQIFHLIKAVCETPLLPVVATTVQHEKHIVSPPSLASPLLTASGEQGRLLLNMHKSDTITVSLIHKALAVQIMPSRNGPATAELQSMACIPSNSAHPLRLSLSSATQDLKAADSYRQRSAKHLRCHRRLGRGPDNAWRNPSLGTAKTADRASASKAYK